MDSTPPEDVRPGPDGPDDDQGATTRTDDQGPRVTADQMKDLARLRRTVGPDRRIAGVAAGVARHLDVDPLLLRVAFVVTALFGGAGFFLYLGLWLVVPDDRGHVPISTRDRTRSLIVAVLLAITAIGVLGAPFGSQDLWPVVMMLGVVGVALLLSQRDRGAGPGPAQGWGPSEPLGGTESQDTGVDADPTIDEAALRGYPGYRRPRYGEEEPASPYADDDWERPLPPSPPADPRRRGPVLFWGVLAAIVLGWGVLLLVDVTGSAVPFAAYPALAVALVGAGLLLGSVWGRAGGLIALGLLLLVPLGIGAAADRIDPEPVRLTPTAGDELPGTYSWNVGDHVLDLTDLSAAELDRNLVLDGGVGRIRVIVPDDVDVHTVADVGLGQLRLFGERTGEPGAHLEHTSDVAGDEQLDLRIDLGVGDVIVVREGER